MTGESLTCRTCGAALDAAGLDRRLAIVTCAHCGAIYDLTRQPDRAAARPAEAAPALGTSSMRMNLERAPVALPSRFQVKTEGGRLEVKWRWFSAVHVFLLFFAIVWNGFLVFWYAMALSPEGPPGPARILVLVFPIIHVAVGIGVAYTALTGLVNRTSLSVDPLMLRVRHYPLPWWPSPSIPVSELEQLYVTRRVSRGKQSTTITFDLRAVTREHQALMLVRGFDEIEQALYLEQEIERQLGIRDRPVTGEYRPADVQT